MSMSVRCDGCGLEYAGAKGSAACSPSRRARCDPRFLRMLVEVKRFHRPRPALLDTPSPTPTAPDPRRLPRRRALSRVLRRSTSSCHSCRACGRARPGPRSQYPAHSLFTFLDHHGALTVHGSPSWRTVVGGSRSYVERAAKELTATRAVHAGAPACAGTAAGIEIRDDADEARTFDAAVVATHADDALALLADPTSRGARRARRVRLVDERDRPAHRRLAVLPTRPRARASWNYLLDRCGVGRDGVHVSYDMNRLHRLDEPVDYLVTLNPGGRVHDRRASWPGCGTRTPCTPRTRSPPRPRSRG